MIFYAPLIHNLLACLKKVKYGLSRLGSVIRIQTGVMLNAIKILFLGIIVHSVHYIIFSFIIIKIGGD